MFGIVVFWMKNVDPIPYQLSEEDAALFRQPTVERFRLSYVDFSVFGTVDKTYFMYLNLKTLDLEVCPCGHRSSSVMVRALRACEILWRRCQGSDDLTCLCFFRQLLVTL